jgi:hypothetical protein
MLMGSALFWDIMRRLVVIVYQRFGTFLLGLLTREDGTDALSRNVGKQLRRRVISQKSAELYYM